MNTKLRPPNNEFPYSVDLYTPAAGLTRTKALIDTLFTPKERYEMIAHAAYLRSEQRGFEAGHELEDWLWAEHQVDSACGLFEPEPPRKPAKG